MQRGLLFMNCRKLLLAGVAMTMAALSSSAADAGERMSVYEINNFVSRLTNAVNNPDPAVGRTFLARYLNEDAEGTNTIVHAGWAGNMDHQYRVWHQYNSNSYYRYPHAYNPYFKPTSVRSMDKTEMIAQFESKKHMIPRYNQQINILSSRMPADGKTAVLDVDVREFGLGYAGYGYAPHYGGQVLHTAANCQLYLEKENHEIVLNRMACNTTMNPTM